MPFSTPSQKIPSVTYSKLQVINVIGAFSNPALKWACLNNSQYFMEFQQNPQTKSTGWDWGGYVLRHSCSHKSRVLKFWLYEWISTFSASLKEKVSRRMDGGIYLSVANVTWLVLFPPVVFVVGVILYHLHWQTKEEIDISIYLSFSCLYDISESMSLPDVPPCREVTPSLGLLMAVTKALRQDLGVLPDLLSHL